MIVVRTGKITLSNFLVLTYNIIEISNTNTKFDKAFSGGITLSFSKDVNNCTPLILFMISLNILYLDVVEGGEEFLGD